MLLFACVGVVVQAQVTTSTLTGLVEDTKGEAVIGASVLAVHVPSGTKYGVVTKLDGRYTIPNMRVGGPYTVSVTSTGYKPYTSEGLMLSLAQKLTLDVKLEDVSTTLGEAVITADLNSVLNGNRTGAASNFSNEQIAVLPTISRSASDVYRLNAASDGNSFGGRNDQFNNFSLDGTIFNNPFGLDAATPGGQADAQPVSLDAIDQIQVSLAPYDVTQSGFTGAAINAVTKSGTNTVKGTVFGFYRNQDMVGSKINDFSSPVPDLTQFQTGFSIGGPIVKDKVFFFANFEMERRQDLGSAYLAARPGLTGQNVSRVDAADLELVSSVLKSRFGYETGAYEGYKLNTDNQKALFKLDFNLSKTHKLTTTFNYLDALKQKPAHPNAIGRRGPDATTLQFANSGYQINNKIYSGIAELKSAFGSTFSNKFQIGYSAFRDARDPASAPMPVININKDGIRYIVAGHEPFSINNVLDQDVFQVNDNFNIYQGKHTYTIGASFEKFMFNNSFNLGTYDPFPFNFNLSTFGGGFASVADFVTAVNNGDLDAAVAGAQATYDTNTKDGKWALAETNLGQAAAYLQDEIAINNNFTLTVGLRGDLPLYFDTPQKAQEVIDRAFDYNPDITYFDESGKTIKFDHTVLPKQRLLISPRVGFNWDVKGDRTQQLRGGSGLFTGRFPFVWVGNQVANPNFWFYCVTHPNFKYPQVWRTNLGYDQKFGKGWIASIDLMHTKDVNAMMVRNYGLNLPSGTLPGPGARPVYTAADRTSFGNNAYVFTNTEKGYTFNATAQLQRNWAHNLYTSLAYNYGVAHDASSIDAEISSDAYDRNPAIGHVNEAVSTNSLYGNQHRIVGNASKKFIYAKGRLGTTVSLFFQYAKGGRYSNTYSGDINGDGSSLNDLIYIPTAGDLTNMTFSGTTDQQTAQKAALESYIQQDEYLSANRGQFYERYATLSPWYNNWDLRILQDLNIKVSGTKTNTLQLSIDVLNIGNLINPEWGVRQLPTNTQPIGVAVGTDGIPVYSFDANLKSTFTPDPSFLSRWQAQVGLRYIF